MLSDTLFAWAIWAVVWGGTVFLWMWNREVRAHKRILESHHKAIMRNYEYLDEIDELKLEVASLTETLDGSIAWRGRKREMTWTKTPPTEPGWYWARRINPLHRTPHLVHVKEVEPGVLLGTFDRSAVFCTQWTQHHEPREWSGPIPLPEEPK